MTIADIDKYFSTDIREIDSISNQVDQNLLKSVGVSNNHIWQNTSSRYYGQILFILMVLFLLNLWPHILSYKIKLLRLFYFLLFPILWNLLEIIVVKIYIEKYRNFLFRGHLIHQIFYVKKLVLQVESDASVLEHASADHRPVTHVIESPDNELTLVLHVSDRLSKVILLIFFQIRFKFFILLGLFHYIASFYNLWDGHRNLLKDGVVDHLLKVLLCFDLLVEHAKGDILKEGHRMNFIIYAHFLRNYID